jgi:tetrahydromethanopterin S-methyltransferase subunit A
MNDVDMDKIIDLVEMANKRVNLFIAGINITKLLEKEDSKHILDNIKDPVLKDDGKHDSLLTRMISIGRTHIVEQMHEIKPKTDLIP